LFDQSVPLIYYSSDSLLFYLSNLNKMVVGCKIFPLTPLVLIEFNKNCHFGPIHNLNVTIFANESIYGKSVRIVRVSTYEEHFGQ